jgi:hypothetical protein
MGNAVKQKLQGWEKGRSPMFVVEWTLKLARNGPGATIKPGEELERLQR